MVLLENLCFTHSYDATSLFSVNISSQQLELFFFCGEVLISDCCGSSWYVTGSVRYRAEFSEVEICSSPPRGEGPLQSWILKIGRLWSHIVLLRDLLFPSNPKFPKLPDEPCTQVRTMAFLGIYENSCASHDKITYKLWYSPSPLIMLDYIFSTLHFNASQSPPWVKLSFFLICSVLPQSRVGEPGSLTQQLVKISARDPIRRLCDRISVLYMAYFWWSLNRAPLSVATDICRRWAMMYS